jgi:hypothetical protein
MALRRRLRQARSLSPQNWADLARAVWELALANRRLARGASPTDIVRIATAPQAEPDPALIARVGWAIPRAAAVVPWRSDCLRQATAARRWLGQAGIAAEIRLGARKDEAGRFHAHAWLICQGEVLIGGSIEEFQPFA